MKKTFPKQFLWGTSTAACQIESTKGTSWYGLETRDQTSVDKNIEHDRYRTEDAKIITGLGNAYRFNPDWAKLQRAPFGKLNPSAVKDYRNFLEILKSKGMHVMLTLHHFANPDWFETAGSWQSSQAPMNISELKAKEYASQPATTGRRNKKSKTSQGKSSSWTFGAESRWLKNTGKVS